MINLRRPFGIFCLLFLNHHYAVTRIADGEKFCARCGRKLDKWNRPRA